MRHAARTDANQAEIVKALRNIGVQVEYIKLPLDLLISTHHGESALMEVKMPGEKLNKSQEEFVKSWWGKVFVVDDPHQAVDLVVGWMMDAEHKKRMLYGKDS